MDLCVVHRVPLRKVVEILLVVPLLKVKHLDFVFIVVIDVAIRAKLVLQLLEINLSLTKLQGHPLLLLLSYHSHIVIIALRVGGAVVLHVGGFFQVFVAPSTVADLVLKVQRIDIFIACLMNSSFDGPIAIS